MASYDDDDNEREPQSSVHTLLILYRLVTFHVDLLHVVPSNFQLRRPLAFVVNV